MRYAISDIKGDTLEIHDGQRSAVAAIFEMIDRGESPAHELFLLAYRDDGEPFGDAVRGDELLARRVRIKSPTDTVRPGAVRIDEASRLSADIETSEAPETDAVLA